MAAEERANASEAALKLAQEAIAKLEADLKESKAAKEVADSEASKAYEAGQSAALTNYVEEVPKFENRGFKHGWLKALVAAAGVTLACGRALREGLTPQFGLNLSRFLI